MHHWAGEEWPCWACIQPACMHMYACICVCTRVYVWACVRACVCGCVRACACVGMFVYVCVCVTSLGGQCRPKRGQGPLHMLSNDKDELQKQMRSDQTCEWNPSKVLQGTWQFRKRLQDCRVIDWAWVRSFRRIRKSLMKKASSYVTCAGWKSQF